MFENNITTLISTYEKNNTNKLRNNIIRSTKRLSKNYKHSTCQLNNTLVTLQQIFNSHKTVLATCWSTVIIATSVLTWLIKKIANTADMEKNELEATIVFSLIQVVCSTRMKQIHRYRHIAIVYSFVMIVLMPIEV